MFCISGFWTIFYGVRQRLSQETLSGIVYTQCMLSYNKWKDSSRDFLAATGLTPDEFQQVLPAFQGPMKSGIRTS